MYIYKYIYVYMYIYVHIYIYMFIQISVHTVDRKKRRKVLILFFLKVLHLKGKFMSLLKFFCCLGVYLKLCLRIKLI
jgi:hypothetical protein